MIDVGLLVLKGTRSMIEQKLPALLRDVLLKVKKKLYVKLDVTEQKDLIKLVLFVYRNASIIPNNIDLRVLLNRKRQISIDRLFEERNGEGYISVRKKFWIDENCVSVKKPYDSVVLGGTFDRIHNGHKVLLSVAILNTNNVLTCGVTDGEMNKKKILWELIQPIETRCELVNEFVADVSDNIDCRVVPIFDAFGPSIVDKDINAIIVSEETLKGGNLERNLSKLDIHIVKIIKDKNDVLNETKVSSSSQRLKLLGTTLCEPVPKKLFPGHYVVGLTGGIASGKTHISNFLEKNDCAIIDCDKICHELYAESQKLRSKLALTFGYNVLSLDNTINRRKLGEIVFGNKTEMDKLNNIVWPEIASKAREYIAKAKKKIVIIDAAIMLEAGWDSFVDEVWTSIVPPDEAIKRICSRNNVSTEQAEKRVFSQMSNSDRVARSNVIFCSLWDYSETEAQVMKALNSLNKRLIN